MFIKINLTIRVTKNMITHDKITKYALNVNLYNKSN